MHGWYFEDYVTTAIQDRYNIICSIEAYDRKHPTVNYDASSGGVRSFIPDSIEDALVSLEVTLDFVDSWLQ